MTPIAPHITAFFQKRLAVDRRVSPHTSDTYAYAFQLLLTFMSRRFGVAPADLALEQLDAPLVLEFLEQLQKERHNASRTRNARLAAIRSFMRFVEHRVPAALDQVRRVRAIPAQRTDTRIVRHLSVPEHRALLDAPEPTSRLASATAPCWSWRSPAACACPSSSACASLRRNSTAATRSEERRVGKECRL